MEQRFLGIYMMLIVYISNPSCVFPLYPCILQDVQFVSFNNYISFCSILFLQVMNYPLLAINAAGIVSTELLPYSHLSIVHLFHWFGSKLYFLLRNGMYNLIFLQERYHEVCFSFCILTEDRSCDNELSREKSHCFAFGSVVATRLWPSSSSTRAQEHLDAVHSNNECRHESGDPQKPQELVVDMCRWARTSSVGSDCLASLHKNILIFPRTWVFHSVFQSLLLCWFRRCPQSPLAKPLSFA